MQSSLNDFFAKSLLKDDFTEERATFLRSLMEASRQGNLCWESGQTCPLPERLVQEGSGLAVTAPVIRDRSRYYLHKNWIYETVIVQQVVRLRNIQVPEQPLVDPEPLTPSQAAAVQHALTNNFTLICGGPGTGKTYTAGVIAKQLTKSKIVLAAPTGKAASHLQASMGLPLEAMTLHRLLKLKPGENRLSSLKKIDADVVFVDEASMIDVALLAHLLSAIGDDTKLILLGDPDQLPPIEAGSLFAEMASSFGCPLRETMRTDKQALHELANQINRGQHAIDEALFLPWDYDETLIAKLYRALNPYISLEKPQVDICAQQLQAFRILGALRQGPFGIDAINERIVAAMFHHLKPEEWWAIPIMITSNDAASELYNGDCGILVGQGDNIQKGTAYFGQRSFLASLLPSYEIAFCLSIHKSQGSEFDQVMVLLPPGSENFGKEAVYTAVTRAKNGVSIVAKRETLQAMLSQSARRVSGFIQRLV